MKKLPYIIGIPFIGVALVLGGAMIWKLKTQTVDTVATAKPMTLPSAVKNAGGTPPTNPFSFLFGQQTTSEVTPIPTPTPASAAALSTEVNSVGDDGGTSDFNSLNAQTNGL